jgi:enoyl-CoA hydratase
LEVGTLPYEDIVVEVEGNLQIVKLNRPEVRNALRERTLAELYSALKEFEDDEGRRALIITSAVEGFFCAGGDIREMVKMTSADAKRFAEAAHKVLDKIEGVPKPVIAAVDGVALGAGFDLALACDICIATKRAVFGQPPPGIGIITPFGGHQRLARAVGPMWAKYLFFTGETLDAESALRMGIVCKVVEPDRLLPEAKEVARRILSRAPIAIGFCKRLINSSIIRSVDEEEISLYAKCFETRDREEGMRAFLEKRRPVFVGK